MAQKAYMNDLNDQFEKNANKIEVMDSPNDQPSLPGQMAEHGPEDAPTAEDLAQQELDEAEDREDSTKGRWRTYPDIIIRQKNKRP